MGPEDLGPPEDGVLGHEGAVAGLQTDDIGQHRPVDTDRKAPGHVPSVVCLGDQDRVGPVARRHLRRHRRGHGRAGEGVTEIADAVDHGGPVRTSVGRDGPGVTPRDCLHGPADLVRLGQQFERDRRRPVATTVDDNPDLVQCHLLVCLSVGCSGLSGVRDWWFGSAEWDQMTLSCSRKATILS